MVCKIYSYFWKKWYLNFWPPRPFLTLEVKLKISNFQSSETITDILTNSFLQNCTLKYTTFELCELWPWRSYLTSEVKLNISKFHSSKAIIDILTNWIHFCKVFLSNTEIFTEVNFALGGHVWPSRSNWKFHSSEVITNILISSFCKNF